MCVFCVFRLLGTLSVSLQEVVSRGSQNLSSALKSKKGDIMQVSWPMDKGGVHIGQCVSSIGMCEAACIYIRG